MIQCRISHFLRDVLTSQNKYNWYPQNRIRWCGVDLFKRSTSSLRSKIWISIRFNLEQPVTSFWQQVSQKNWSAWPLKSTSIKVCQLWAGLRIIQCLSFGFLCVCCFLSTVYPNILQYWYALVVVCFMCCSKKTYNRSCTQTNYISISSPSSSRFLWFIYPRDNQCRGWWANKRFHRELVVKLLSLGGGSQARMKVSVCTVSSVVFEQPMGQGVP